MGAMFRSEEMALAQLFIQPEAAYHVVSELGESGCVQFRDLNEDSNLFQREYSTEVKRCNEMERQLRYIEAEIKKSDVVIPDVIDLPKAPNPRQIVDLEAHLGKTEREVLELTGSSTGLKSRYAELVERKNVLQKAQAFFNQKEEAQNELSFSQEEAGNASHLGFVAGVINSEKVFTLEKLLWRIGRGNIFFRYEDILEPIEDPVTGVDQKKFAFIAFYQGENLQSKVKKICSGFRAHIFDCPSSLHIRNEQLKVLLTEVQDIKTVLNQTEDHRTRLLVSVAKEIQNWSVMVCKMKAIYHTLNLFSQDVTKKCLIAEGWVPTGDMSKVQKALAAGSVACGSTVPSFLNVLETKDTPPTFNRTNKFTRGFQNLISAYAFASYQELNPALYTIISFPFLFAVMFGDLGHGVIVTLFALWMVISEKKIGAQKNKSEIFSIFFGGRYIILLMGIFSMYTGFMYNDIFSKSMNIFGTRWLVRDLPVDFTNYTGTTDSEVTFEYLPRVHFKGDPYYCGLDPIWQTPENKIIFLNSFKMKLSIVFGVVHMLFGVIMSTVNFINFKKHSALLLDFLPKILFFVFLFLYLVIMTFMKWTMYSGEYDGKNDTDTSPNVDTVHGTSCAPSVLIYFINMMLLKKSVATAPCEAYMYDGQEIFQKVLLFAALICIPVMLLGTPLYELSKRKKKHQRVAHGHDNGHVNHGIELETVPENSVIGAESHEEEEEEPFSEIFVHSAIHTIEYTLSTVSHTASYLRLWALSLAHAQLSEVLWSMVFRKGLVLPKYIGAPFIFLIFGFWAFATVAILVLMEGLSAFLHTLRLHWVEFMTKFYEGAGYNFAPFSFKAILDEEEVD